MSERISSRYLAVKYLPAWFPGGGFQRHAVYVRQLSAAMRYEPFNAVKERLVRGSVVVVVVFSLLLLTLISLKGLPYRAWPLASLNAKIYRRIWMTASSY